MKHAWMPQHLPLTQFERKTEPQLIDSAQHRLPGRFGGRESLVVLATIMVARDLRGQGPLPAGLSSATIRRPCRHGAGRLPDYGGCAAALGPSQG